MTGEPEDLTEPEGPEAAIEDSLDAWGQSTAEPTWIPIDSDAQPAPSVDPITEVMAAAQSEPAPAAKAASESTPTAGKPTAAAPTPPPSAPAAPGGRPRRPSSLRAALDDRIPNVPRRPIAPPPFDGDTPPAKPAPAPSSDQPAPADLAREFASSLPKRLVALTNERPEVGLGVAFLGGLVIATILKRLGRK